MHTFFDKDVDVLWRWRNYDSVVAGFLVAHGSVASGDSNNRDVNLRGGVEIFRDSIFITTFANTLQAPRNSCGRFKHVRGVASRALGWNSFYWHDVCVSLKKSAEHCGRISPQTRTLSFCYSLLPAIIVVSLFSFLPFLFSPSRCANDILLRKAAA